MSKIFKHKDFELTIFVEDTDFQGFVYHANYIKYFERARSNFLTINGISQNDLRQSNLGFVIKRIDIDFLYPAKLGEKLIVQTEVEKKSKARMLNKKKIMRNKIVSIFVFLFFSIVFVIFFKGLKETNIYTPDLDIKKEIPFFHAKDFYTGKKLNTSDIFV